MSDARMSGRGSTKPGRDAVSGEFAGKRSGRGAEFAPVTKPASITQAQANSAVQNYRGGSVGKK